LLVPSSGKGFFESSAADTNAPSQDPRFWRASQSLRHVTVPKYRFRVTLGRTLGMHASSAWFVYILRCRDASLYTGIARDVAARILSHEAGRGARYTRGRGPFVLCAKRRCGSQSEALKLEYAIKQLSRSDKERLTRPRRLAAFARALFRVNTAEPRAE
jgi:putative endonuclease